MTAGWYPDPTGRFPARYYDGTDWSDQVQGADGQVARDVIERRSSGLAAPAPTPAPAPAGLGAPAWGPPGGGWGAPPNAPAAGLDRSTGTIGLVVAGVGWLLAMLSVFAIDWVDGGTRGDISDNLPSSLPDGAELVDQLWFAYLSWAALALVVAVGVGLGVVAVLLRSEDPTGPRLAVGALATVAVVLHTVSVVRFLGDAAEPGAQLGIVGYLAVVAGLALGSRTRPG